MTALGNGGVLAAVFSPQASHTTGDDAWRLAGQECPAYLAAIAAARAFRRTDTFVRLAVSSIPTLFQAVG